jgi:NOL1/NOP2/sun family putative RNA methylase
VIVTCHTLSVEIPAEFLARIKNQLGDEFEAFLAHYDEPAEIGLRVNTLKLIPAAFAERTPFKLAPVPWAPAGFLVDSSERPGKHPYHTAGLYYLQDPAAMAVTELLNPQPGERILDLAAAPGGKTTHIAARMQNRGLLIANDLMAHRAQVLAKNIERWGATNTVVLNETPARLAAHFGAFFDRVLVDAPCSGEGMFRKEPATRSDWMPKLVESCALRQDTILAEAALLVRPGGILVYSTCTFTPTEDEGSIARFLTKHPEFEIESPPRYPGFSPGRPDWLDDEHLQNPALKQLIRLWPHNAPGEGHFIAVLRKTSGEENPLREAQATPPENAARHDFQQFCTQTLHRQPDETHLSQQGAYIYTLPAGCPDLRGLRVVHWGWWLGIAKKNRFEPSHALAMGLQPTQIKNTHNLVVGDAALAAYLRGEVLSSPGENGWVMLTVDGFPLGWGKRVNNRIKPHLPNWLRQF